LFAIVAVPFDAHAALPRPEHRWLLTCLSRYADRSGRAFPSLRQLARDARMPLSSTARYLSQMEQFGVFTRTRRPGGRYTYVLAEPYRPRWPRGVPAVRNGVPRAGTQEAKLPKYAFKEKRFADELPLSPWEQRLRGWRENRFWLPQWGPKPNEAGCFAPIG
jgi:hypothetical protein